MKESSARSSRESITETSRDKKIFYAISEVSKIVGVEPYVLRYWEQEFTILKPKKSDSGHRLYRQEDIDVVMKIKHLLYEKKFTIKGAKKILSNNNRTSEIEQIRDEIQDILGLL